MHKGENYISLSFRHGEGKKSSGLVATIDKSFLSSKMTACRNHFLQKTVPKMRKMFLVTYLACNERILRGRIRYV